MRPNVFHFASLLALFGALSCENEPSEYIVRIDTDAVVPDPEASDPYPPMPMFDRLELTVFPADATEPCSNCTRTFAVEAASLRRRQISVGIPLSMRGARVRVRLFRGGTTGLPRPASTLEVVGKLPDASEHMKLAVVLQTETLGRPTGTLEDPIALDEDTDAPSRVGTVGTSFAPCESAPPDGTTCIAGRYMWATHLEDPAFEKLTRISTFFVDLHEWSAARFRETDGKVDHQTDTTTLFTPNPTCDPDNDDAPAACMSAAEAVRLCRKVGGRLPSFQEFEMLAGGLRGFHFPWGNDSPACTDAVVSRIEVRLARGWTKQLCSKEDLGGYPSGAAPVSDPFGRDVLEIGGASVLGLAGNLSEWTQASLFDSCAEEAFITSDPRCDDRVTYAGGNFGNPTPASSMRQALKLFDAAADARIGFRCVYDLP